MRVDRVIKRNEANDRLDKYCREIVLSSILYSNIGSRIIDNQGFAAK